MKNLLSHDGRDMLVSAIREMDNHFLYLNKIDRSKH